MELSHYQEAILDEVRHGSSNILVKAGAGSGKTQLLEWTMQELPSTTSACLMAFSKAIAEELGQRMPKHCQTSTINSAGFYVSRMHNPAARFDQGKVHKLVMMLCPNAPGDLIYQVKRLVSLGKAYGYGYHSGSQHPLQAATYDSWRYFLTRHALDIDADDEQDAIEMADDVLWENNQHTEMLDYDDQVYFPVIFDYRTPKYDFVGIDESADLSTIQRFFVGKLLSHSSRAMFCGDKFQSIMSFRGANSDSMDLIQQEFDCKVLPLSITYRCPKRIVQEANVFVPELEAAPWAEEGKILRPQYYDASLFRNVQNGVILCRNNAPLMSMAIRLLRNKIRFYMQRHGDFVESLKNFILKFKAKNIAELFQKMGQWEHRQLEKCYAHGQEMKAQYIVDKCACVQFLAKEVSTVEGVLQLLDTIFQEKGYLKLSTIHGFKGLQADDVFFLDKFLIPSKYAKQPWQIQQERNVAYVGITRTKKRLHYINSNAME